MNETKTWSRLAVWGLVALVASTSSIIAQRIGGRGQRELQAPTNPDEIHGTWTIAGDKKSLTAGEFFKIHQAMSKMDATAQSAVPARRVWEVYLTAQEAEASGLAVSAAEIDQALRKDEPDLYEGLIARWGAAGISETDAREITRMKLLGEKLMNLAMNTTRVTAREAFDHFKLNRMNYKVGYALFDSATHESQVDMTKVDDAELERFWSQRIEIQRRFREPNTVSAEFISLDPASYPLEKAEKHAGGRKVSRQDALRHFWKNKAALLKQVPSDKQHLLVVKADTKLGDIVTPFSVLEDQIKKAMLLKGVLDDALKKSRREGKSADLPAIANQYGLRYNKFDTVNRAKSITLFRQFGYNTFNSLNGRKSGEYSANVESNGPVRFFCRLNDRKVARLPSFAEIKDRLREEYLHYHSREKARAEARSIMQEIDKRTEESVKELRGRIETDASAAAAKKINELGISDEKEVNRIRIHERARAARFVETKKNEMRPRFFEEIVKARDIKVHETDYFEYESIRADRMIKSDPETAKNRFLRSSYYVRTLAPGQVAPVLLEDPVSRSFFIIRLLEKKDPPLESMGPVDLMQARTQLKQRRENELMQRWRFGALQMRFGLQTK